jgi:hypothetical protein
MRARAALALYRARAAYGRAATRMQGKQRRSDMLQGAHSLMGHHEALAGKAAASAWNRGSTFSTHGAS